MATDGLVISQNFTKKKKKFGIFFLIFTLARVDFTTGETKLLVKSICKTAPKSMFQVDYKQFPIFPQGQSSERNASVRENHPTREKTTRGGEREKFFSLPVACLLFLRAMIFTRARVSFALLSLSKNGGLLVVYVLGPNLCLLF